jgi:hypothetical protein
LRADNAVDGKPGIFMKQPHRSLQLRSEYAINAEREVGRPAQRSLQPPHDIAGGTRADRRLTLIGHPLIHQSQKETETSANIWWKTENKCDLLHMIGAISRSVRALGWPRQTIRNVGPMAIRSGSTTVSRGSVSPFR